MKVWKTTYLKKGELLVYRMEDYWHSVNPITIEQQQAYWDKVWEGRYTIEEFTCEEVTGQVGDNPRGRIIEIVWQATICQNCDNAYDAIHLACPECGYLNPD
jgi:hypothetical protein